MNRPKRPNYLTICSVYLVQPLNLPNSQSVLQTTDSPQFIGCLVLTFLKMHVPYKGPPTLLFSCVRTLLLLIIKSKLSSPQIGNSGRISDGGSFVLFSFVWCGKKGQREQRGANFADQSFKTSFAMTYNLKEAVD